MKRMLSAWYNNLHLHGKFILILFVVAMIILLGTASALQVTRNAYDETLSKTTIQLLTQFSQAVQAELDGIAQTSFNITTDNILQDALSEMHSKRYTVQHLIELNETINKRLMNVSLQYSDIVSIRLHAKDSSEFYRIMPGRPIPSELLQEYGDRLSEMQGRELWVPYGSDAGSVYLMREVREIEDLTLDSLAVLLMRIDLGRIVARNMAALNKVNASLKYAIDLDGERVYANDDSMLALQIDSGSHKIVTIDGEARICVRYAPTGSHWAYLATLSYDSIYDAINWTAGLSLIVTLSAMLIAILLGSFMIASIVKSIRALLLKYDLFAKGDLDLSDGDPAFAHRLDEIGELHRHFDRMARENRAMIEDNYVKQQLLLEAQVQQLRAQIRPHFIYNTLESIYCLAETSGNSQIATMTSALGQMLRATLNHQKTMASLKEELRIVAEYVSIQKIRLEERLSFKNEIPATLDAVRIPSMTIQPLVENAVHHAAEEMIDICRIRIFCERFGDILQITVEDNGPGMDENILEKLENSDARVEGLGIGLLNIHKRLQYAFGDKRYGLSIRCENGLTHVNIRIPAEETADD